MTCLDCERCVKIGKDYACTSRRKKVLFHDKTKFLLYEDRALECYHFIKKSKFRKILEDINE